MKLKEVARCVVRISVNEQIIRKGLENLKTQDRTIVISEIMKVSLSEATTLEGKHFEIEEITENKQRVRIQDVKDYTEWLFNVKPLKKGKHKLSLKVFIIEKIDNEEVNQQLTFEEVVEVSAKKSKIVTKLKELVSFALPSYNFVKVIGDNNVIIQNSKNVIIGSKIGISGGFHIGDQIADKIYNIEKIDNANFDLGVESVTLNLFGVLSFHIKMYSKSNEKFTIDLTKGGLGNFNTLQFSQREFLCEVLKNIDKIKISDLKPVFKTLLRALYDMQKQNPDNVLFGDLEVDILITLYMLATNMKVKVIYEKYNQLFEREETTKEQIINALQVLADYGLITQNDNGEISLIETVKISRYE